MVFFNICSMVGLIVALLAAAIALHNCIVVNNWMNNIQKWSEDMDKIIARYIQNYLAKIAVDNAETIENNNDNNTEENETQE